MSTAELLNEYYAWLTKNYRVNKIDNDSDEIITPFLDSLNDNIYLYATRLGKGKIKLSDDGYTLNNLGLSGLSIDTNARKQLLNEILFSYGAQLEDDELVIVGSELDFPRMKLNMISLITRIEDLMFTKHKNVVRLFKDDLITYFNDNDFGGLTNHSFKGKSGVDYTITYVIPRRKNTPQRLFDGVSSLSKTIMMQYAYQYNDLQNKADFENSEYYLIHDKETASSSVEAIAHDVGIQLIPFKDKERLQTLRAN